MSASATVFDDRNWHKQPQNYDKANDKPQAVQFYKEFLKSWAKADKDLPQIAEKWLK